MEDLADTRLAQKISQLPGIGLVSIVGGQKPAVRIQANPTALSAYGLNLEDLRVAVQQTSINQAKGNFDGPQQAYLIDGNDQLMTSQDYSSVVVAYRNGAPVMLTDVADAVDGVENTKQAAWMNQTRPSSSTSSASPARTSSRSWTASRRGCRNCRARCPPRSSLHPDRPHHDHPRLGQGH